MKDSYVATPKNAERGIIGLAIVLLFKSKTGSDNEDVIKDIITDLAHLCAQSHLYGDFCEELERGLIAFFEESEGKE